MMPADFDHLKPFRGLKVLDLSGILAGPMTSSFFAELGAKVIKVENKLTAGDATRQWKLPAEDMESEYSAYYWSANYGKEVLLLDLTQETDRNKVEHLLVGSDIVISNFQKKVAQKLGLEPHEVVRKYPELIFAQLSAYDYDDPNPGYDLVMQAETGWISMTGYDDQHLAKLPVALIDIIASHQMKEAILTALWKKAIIGDGTLIHVSLYKSSISALANQASNYLMNGEVPVPMGTLHPNIAPYGDLYLSSEHHRFILAVGSDAQFKKLWFTLNISEEYYHTFEHNVTRVKNRSALNTILQQRFSALTYAEINELCKNIGVPVCSVLSMEEVFNTDGAKQMVLHQLVDGTVAKSVSTVAFTLK